jgi:hypothetical protein
MKILRFTLTVMVTGLMLSAQTIHVGQHVYFSGEGQIDIAADAGLAVQNLDQPYVPFVLFIGMAPGERYIAGIHKDNVVMIYKDQEYKLPTVQDFRKEYRGDSRDARTYERLFAGVESLLATQMRHYHFQLQNQYFPARNSGKIAVDEGSISSSIGFATFAYFKNPGFQYGDTVVIKVSDKKSLDFWGSVEIELRDPKQK